MEIGPFVCLFYFLLNRNSETGGTAAERGELYFILIDLFVKSAFYYFDALNHSLSHFYFYLDCKETRHILRTDKEKVLSDTVLTSANKLFVNYVWLGQYNPCFNSCKLFFPVQAIRSGINGEAKKQNLFVSHRFPSLFIVVCCCFDTVDVWFEYFDEEKDVCPFIESPQGAQHPFCHHVFSCAEPVSDICTCICFCIDADAPGVWLGFIRVYIIFIPSTGMELTYIYICIYCSWTFIYVPITCSGCKRLVCIKIFWTHRYWKITVLLIASGSFCPYIMMQMRWTRFKKAWTQLNK